MNKQTTPPPGFPYGDPEDNWLIDAEDFYKHVDAAFESWYDGAQARANLGAAMPHELTALQPEPRKVRWKLDRHTSTDVDERREWQLPAHPDVAAEAERLDAIERPSKEECSRPFSPSPLACYRAGFAEGLNREKGRANKDWEWHLGLHEEEAETGWARGTLKRTVQAKGADYARQLLDEVIAELDADQVEPPAQRGLHE